MDAPWSYRWWGYTQHISRKEIEKMKKNMKKVPVIQLKTEIYHTKEVNEADKILGELSSLEVESLSPPQTQTTNTTILSKLILLRKHFISLF